MPTLQPIRTERLVLRDFAEDDWPAVHRYGSDPEVVKYMTFPPNTEQRSREVVEEWLAEQAHEPRQSYTLAITLSATAELIGGACVRWVSPKQHEASMGYILRQDCWGRGYATEAGRALLRLGFEHMGAHRVFATCDVENMKSARVLEKLGMTREGLHRQNLWCPNRNGWRDTYYYALLEDEWKRQHHRGSQSIKV